ncbi:unnamed protein product [Mytilus coruscus]|uniref:MRC n=1 Tax=Mytilus coruscus TaxID=42192 RepID=A0A6J8BTI6_MYTCO|nr:unnamed protein product [Mytilus coruscus]
MLGCKIWMYTFLVLPMIQNGKTQCNLKNGQCTYDMKIGHQGQCDSLTSTSLSGSGGHITGSCTCDDVSSLSNHMNAMKYTESNLKQLMADMNQYLNNATTELNSTDSKLQTEKQKGSRLTNTLNSMESQLNQTKDQLKSVLNSATSELTGLRQKLATNTRDLALCQTALGTPVSTNAAIHQDFTTFYCGFQSTDLCHFSQDHHDNTNWDRRHTEESQTGPKRDHTYGNNYGYYMALRATSPVRSSTGTTTSRLISPTFNPAPNYCVRFWYTMYGKDVKTLNVYAQVHGGLGYPVFTHTGNVDNQWHMAEISLNKEYTADMFQVVFEATHNAYHISRYSGGRYHYENHNQYGNIAVDDVYVYNTTCQNVPKYPAGSFVRTTGSKTSYYTFHGNAKTWYDAVQKCKEENIHSNLATVVDAAEQNYLVKLIQSDVSLTAAGQKGFFINGNDYDSENKYKWTASGYPESFNYTNWHVGQPNNVGDNQDCLLMQYPESNYEWGDVSCSEKHPFICETVL